MRARTSAAAYPPAGCLCIESRVRSGAEVIQDRLAFAGSNYKPLLVMRDAWAIEASDALRKMAQLKRTYDREKAAHAAAQAQAAQLGGNGDGQPPAKRMRVRSAQVHKEKHAGSLTVQEGDTCTFVKATSQPAQPAPTPLSRHQPAPTPLSVLSTWRRDHPRWSRSLWANWPADVHAVTLQSDGYITYLLACSY